MQELFTITAATNTLRLDAKRRAETQFTVFNGSGRRVRGRARIVPQNPVAETWLTLVEEAERDFPIAGAQQYVVQVAVPPDAPAGSHAFRLDVVGVENPDEELTQGPSVAFEVPAPEPVKKPFPIWIPIAAIVALVAIVGTIVLVMALGRDDEPPADPAARYNGTWVREAGQPVGLSRLEIQNNGNTITFKVFADFVNRAFIPINVCTPQPCPPECLLGAGSTTLTSDPLILTFTDESSGGATLRLSHQLTLTLLSDSSLVVQHTSSGRGAVLVICPTPTFRFAK